jgi:hypothetical protein
MCSDCQCRRYDLPAVQSVLWNTFPRKYPKKTPHTDLHAMHCESDDETREADSVQGRGCCTRTVAGAQ